METYSDAYQDVTVLKLLGSRGFFLDLGCSDGIDRSNTFLLEKAGWNGILIDYDASQVSRAARARKSLCEVMDVTKPGGIEEALQRLNAPKVLDYISLDVDEASLSCLLNLPLETYSFKFLTFEHDIYVGRADCYDRKNLSEPFLKKYGYIKITDNVTCEGHPYEDWYANPKFIPETAYAKILGTTGRDYKDIYADL